MFISVAAKKCFWMFLVKNGFCWWARLDEADLVVKFRSFWSYLGGRVSAAKLLSHMAYAVQPNLPHCCNPASRMMLGHVSTDIEPMLAQRHFVSWPNVGKAILAWMYISVQNCWKFHLSWLKDAWLYFDQVQACQQTQSNIGSMLASVGKSGQTIANVDPMSICSLGI